jgi:hypothetical protein
MNWHDFSSFVFSTECTTIVPAYPFRVSGDAYPRTFERRPVALKHAIASCKSEAKAKKIKLLERRQYVIDCVQALKDRPQVDVQRVLKNHPDLKGLPCHPNPDPGYKLAC